MTCSLADQVNEPRALLAAARTTFPDALRGPTQSQGEHYAGCVPVEGRWGPVCAVNAGGKRVRFYEPAEKAASPGQAGL